MDVARSLKKTVLFYINFEQRRIFNRYTPKQLGAWSKNELVLMGPTFIKIGQFVSTRGDVFGKEMTDELKSLQDNVAPLEWSSISSSVPKDAFEYVDETPLASASIGQVHLARLVGGKQVVIKVKRPNINDQINADFKGLLAWIKALKLVSSDRRLVEFEILFTEYYKLLLQEIDFSREAENMKRFAGMFSDTNWIKIPTMFPEHSTQSCITMEYVPSIKIDDIEALKKLKFDPSKISAKLLECYVDQIIKHGCVHIDPHPGNLGMTTNGKIVFYDYGMVLDLDEKIQKHFDELLVALYDRNIETVARLAVDIGLVVVEPKNLVYFKKFLLFFLSYIEKMDINDFKVSYIDNIDKSDMPFLISSKFLLLLRGISILEGNCKVLDKQFNYKKTLDPYIQEYLIDVQYLENKAMVDIRSMQTFSSKLKEQEIEMEIMRINSKVDPVKIKTKTSIVVGAVVLAACVSEDYAITMCIGMLATIMLV